LGSTLTNHVQALTRPEVQARGGHPYFAIRLPDLTQCCSCSCTLTFLAIGDWPLAILVRGLVVPLLQLQLHLASSAHLHLEPLSISKPRVHLQSPRATAGWEPRTNYE
jgi:hypothetical protein